MISPCNGCSATKVNLYTIIPKCEYFTEISPQTAQQTVFSLPYFKAHNRYYRHNMFVIIQTPKRVHFLPCDSKIIFCLLYTDRHIFVFHSVIFTWKQKL